MNHAHQQVALAQGLGIGLGSGDFPRHPGQRGGEVVFLLGGARQLDAQRALAFGRPELLENVLPEHLLGDADPDLGDRRRFFPFRHVEPEVIPQVEEAVPVAGADGFEIRVAVSEVRAVGVEQAKLGGEVRRVGDDDEVKMSRHGDWVSLINRVNPAAIKAAKRFEPVVSTII